MTSIHATPVLLWLRRELRIADNRALAAALATGRPVVVAFILDTQAPGRWAPGGASRWWLHHSLTSLAADLERRGTLLILRRGRTEDELPRLLQDSGAREVHAGQPVEPWARTQMDALRRQLPVPLHVHRTSYLFEPDEIRTQSGTPYGVFTPFARACRARDISGSAIGAPAHIPGPANLPRSDRLSDWNLLPTHPDWSDGLLATWTPGEAAATARLTAFAAADVQRYAARRDLPGTDGTSRLSPYLAWGEISPDAIWRAAAAAGDGSGVTTFLNELLWREFSAHLLWHNPGLPDVPLRPEFAAMAWRDDAGGLRAWQRGRTGIPIVDAGMRQLWRTGWMHNRVRMVTASFLTKHLLLPWQAGEAWFWDTLVDADLASNAAQWQWVAGCGADAAPYFRIFNPVLQGNRFDPDGAYVRQYIPELAGVPDSVVHAPWTAALADLFTAHPRYPPPLVDLAHGRLRALDAFAALPKIRA